jgi:hypothetical protein
MDAPKGSAAPLWKRLAWLVLIWTLSVMTLGLLAAAMKFVMSFVGLTI